MESPIGIITYLYHLVVAESKKRKADEEKKKKQQQEEEKRRKSNNGLGTLLNNSLKQKTSQPAEVANISMEDLEDELS